MAESVTLMVCMFCCGFAIAKADTEMELKKVSRNEYHRGYTDGIKEGRKRGKPPKCGSAAR